MALPPSPFEPTNPYATPLPALLAKDPIATPLPTFCKVMFGVSLAFSCLRLLLVPLSLIGYFTMQQQQGNPLQITVIFEVVTGSCVALLGLIGNIQLLMKKWLGIPMGWVFVAAVIASIAVGLWQASILIGNYPAGTPQFAGAIFGAAVTTLIRSVLLGLYVTSLVTFMRWYQQQPL